MTRTAILLGALMLAFTAVLALETRGPDGPVGEPAPSNMPGDVTTAAIPTQAGDRVGPWVAAILARPLFEPSRRPPAAAAQAVPAPVLPRITGVLVSAAGKSVIFAPVGNGQPIVAGEGSRIGVFTVVSIAAGQVTIAGPDGTRVLQPAFDGAAATTSGAAILGAASPPAASVPAASWSATPSATPPRGSGLPALPGLPQLPGAAPLPPLQLPGTGTGPGLGLTGGIPGAPPAPVHATAVDPAAWVAGSPASGNR